MRERTTSDQTSSAGVPGREEGRRERTRTRVHRARQPEREESLHNPVHMSKCVRERCTTRTPGNHD